MPGTLGLRIDVDTYDGAMQGLPRLLERLDGRSIRCSLFVPGGPDRTGMAVARILTQKGYLKKLWRTGAFRVYGPTALATTFLHRSRHIIEVPPLRAALASGHEIVAHGHIHTLWHNSLHHMPIRAVRGQVRDSVAAVSRELGTRPAGFGGPGWQANLASLHALDELGLSFGSDTRGRCPFVPRMHGYTFATPQVPTTLPSLDEFRHGLPPASVDMNALKNAIAAQPYPVYAAHAELEGRFYPEVLDELLDFCDASGTAVVPLGKILEAAQKAGELPVCDVVQGTVPFRPGKVAVQGEAVTCSE